MSKFFRRNLAIFVFVIAAISIFAFSASAASESESNDSYATADTISLGSTVSGTLGSSSDKDYYKLVAPSNGKISITFKHPYVDNEDGWDVRIYQYINGEYTELSYKQIYLRGSESISLPYIGATKNGVYYIYVKNGYLAYGGEVGVNYRIATTFTESEYYEKENNNTYSSANKITLDKSYSGTLNSDSDKDYYKLVAPSNGKINITFKHPYVDNEDGWDIRIYQYNNGEYTELSYKKIYLNGNESISLPYIGAVKNGVYYIYVKNGYLAYGGETGVNYSIATTFTKSEYYEKENNNTYYTANKITLGKSYSGTLSSDSDKDYYKLVAPSNGKIKITFKHPYVDNGDGWDVRVYKYSNGEYTELSYKQIYLRGEKSISLPDIGAVKNGVYYIYVKNGYLAYGGETGVNYTIKASFSVSVSKPTSLSASPTTGSVKLSWNKVSGAKGYVVYKYSSSSGKYTKIGTTTSTSYTVKDLKAGTKYKFAVKAYKTLDGSNYYSGYSSPLTVSTKCSAPTIKLTSTKSKTAKVSITKVTGASKYIVYKSTDNKTWTKAATVTGTTATLSKLTGGKKIYIRVAAVNADGKKSAYSTVKSVTVKR